MLSAPVEKKQIPPVIDPPLLATSYYVSFKISNSVSYNIPFCTIVKQLAY